MHPRGPLVRLEHADRLAGLHEHRLVALEAREGADHRVERRPVAGGLAGAAVDDQLVGMLGDVGVEVVHQHPQRGLLRPALGGERGAAVGADGAGAGDRRHAAIPSVRRPPRNTLGRVGVWDTRFGRDMTGNAPAATRALSALRLLAAAPGPVTAVALGRQLGIPRSSTYHLLAAMSAAGFVTHYPEEERWGLGVGAFEIGAAYLRHDPLERLGRPLLHRLAHDVAVAGTGGRAPRRAARPGDPLPRCGSRPRRRSRSSSTSGCASRRR